MHYPSEDSLEKIRKWDCIEIAKTKNDIDIFYKELKSLLDFMVEIWYYENYASMVEEDDKYVYTLCTGGWSGNEDLIYALGDNRIAWDFTWYSSTVGGKYIFHVKKPTKTN